MRRAKVRPPRVPRGESAKVTIANQARQIKNLTARCSDLLNSKDEAIMLAHQHDADLSRIGNELAREKSYRSADLARLTDAKDTIKRLETHIEGYRMALADFLQPDRIPRIR